MLHDFISNERAELQVELLEVVEYGFDGVWEVLEPGHHVHYAPRAHRLGELVVPAHHLPELLVLIAVPLPEAHGAHRVCRRHHQISQGLEVALRLGFAQEQLQQLSEFTDDVTLE